MCAVNARGARRDAWVCRHASAGEVRGSAAGPGRSAIKGVCAGATRQHKRRNGTRGVGDSIDWDWIRRLVRAPPSGDAPPGGGNETAENGWRERDIKRPDDERYEKLLLPKRVRKRMRRRAAQKLPF